ncbi:hypothetical protein AAG906_039023 [Vitis piasezkii]
MAESSISFFVENLYDSVSQQASLYGAVEGQVRLLRNELEWIRQFLEHADAERRYDKMFKLWVNQIRIKRQQRFNNLKFLNLLPACVVLTDKLRLVNELNGRISEINITLEKILINKRRYGMEDLRAYEPGSSSSIATTSERYSNQMVARKEKRLPTIEETNVLLEGAMERVVVAIWGMGGLGKTTLAMKVSNDTDVRTTCRAWVYVSQEYNIRELLLGIANCVTTFTDEQKRKNENELGEEVYKCLQGKRLRSYFPAESNKSRVLITTRREDIAVDAHSDCYKLQLLGEKESWDLFLNKVGIAAVLTWPGLEEFKKEIVAKCIGLPLRIVVLGGLLSLKDLTQDSWRKVLKSMDWHLSQASELICLWVAEGFVQKGKKMPEDICSSTIGNINRTNSSHLKNSNIRSLILNRSIDKGDEVCLHKCSKLLESCRGLDNSSTEIRMLKHCTRIGRLPPSIKRLVNLPTLDSRDNYIQIPHTIWKLHQMRHLNCFNGEISSRPMRERWVDGHLPPPKAIEAKPLCSRELKEVVPIYSLINGLQKIVNINNNSIPRSSLSHHKCLYKLHLVGTIPKLPVETTLYPPNLISKMPILGRLPNLRILTLLEESYVGTEMNCPHGGFLRLEFLQMQYLGRLEDLSVGKGAMLNLKTLKTECCLKKLQRLNLYHLSQELMSEVLGTEGEDWNYG